MVVGVILSAREVVVGVVMPLMGVSMLLVIEEDDTVVGVTLSAVEMVAGVRLSAGEEGGVVFGTGLSAVEGGGVGPNDSDMVMSVMGVSMLLVGEGSLAIVKTIRK